MQTSNNQAPENVRQACEGILAALLPRGRFPFNDKVEVGYCIQGRSLDSHLQFLEVGTWAPRLAVFIISLENTEAALSDNGEGDPHDLDERILHALEQLVTDCFNINEALSVTPVGVEIVKKNRWRIEVKTPSHRMVLTIHRQHG